MLQALICQDGVFAELSAMQDRQDEDFLMLIAAWVAQYDERQPHHPLIRQMQHRLLPLPSFHHIPRIVVSTWNAQLCYNMTRFFPQEIQEMRVLMNLPELVVLDNRCTEHGDTALAIMLTRYALPCRQFDLSWVYGRLASVIGRFIRHVQKHIAVTWGFLLKWNPHKLTAEVLEGYAHGLVVDKTCPLSNCVGYIDGTVWRICRPGQRQRAFYNGHKRVHSLKYQAVITPDGITVDLSEPAVGSRHDSALLEGSHLIGTLRRYSKGFNGRQMVLYGDAGYPLTDVIITPFPHLGGLGPPGHREFNRQMSRCRVGVEHEFGRVRNILRMTTYEDNLKFFRSNLPEFFLVAVVMKNCLVCCGRGPRGAVIQPPSLHEYFRNI